MRLEGEMVAGLKELEDYVVRQPRSCFERLFTSNVGAFRG